MSLDQNLNKILIIDFGSQFTQLIARRVRELGVFSEIVSHKKIKLKDINHSIKGIVLSGGPLNVYQINKYSFDKKILQLDVPVLGICFGHQILSKLNGGRVKQSKHREFGLANVYKKNNSLLTTNFFGNKKSKQVWMSHADQVSKLPKNFKVVASSTNSKFAIVENKINELCDIFPSLEYCPFVICKFLSKLSISISALIKVPFHLSNICPDVSTNHV